MNRAWRVAVGAAALPIVADCWGRLSPTSRWWATAMVGAICLALPPAVTRLVGVTAPGTVPLTLLAVAATCFACVPETDHFPMVVVALLVTLFAEVSSRRAAPAWWLCAAGLLVVWAGMYGATGRPSALVGAGFAWWPLFAPAALAARGTRSDAARVAVMAGVGAVAAVAVGRTGALADSVGPAVVAVAVAAPASAAAMVVVWRYGRRLGGVVTTPDDRAVATP